MLDQSFSAENFRIIFDEENRKGINLAAKYFPVLENVINDIKVLNQEFKDLINSGLLGDILKVKKKEIRDKVKITKVKKETLLTEALEKLSSDLKSNFHIKLEKIDKPLSKSVYKIANDALSYFVIKQLQKNIHKLYKVKQSNRHEIVNQLYRLLDNDFPKHLVRTDIKDFYESISQEKLLNIINRDTLLSHTSKQYIQEVLNSYKKLSGSEKGIPRGVGVSAYLAELYMRDVDKKIRDDEEVVFYARYVDDIVVLYALKPDSDKKNKLEDIKNKAADSNLALNDATKKTFTLDLSIPKPFIFDYLGYQFRNSWFWENKKSTDEAAQKKKSLKFDLEFSKKKTLRYLSRIKLTFEGYQNPGRLQEKKARELLIKRVRFLTSNTRLKHNKDNALVGIFFSNSLITRTNKIRLLDKFLLKEIAKISSIRLRERLLRMSFLEGFKKKSFHQYSTRTMTDIVKVWKYGT